MASIGLISDTHGTLDPRAVAIFAEEEVVAILHAGDIGPPEIIWELATVAPVTAVTGNCDFHVPGLDLGFTARVPVEGVRFLVIHDFADLGPIPDDVDVVVCGHTHRPRHEWHGPTLVINPGSASRPRLVPAPTVAILDLSADGSWPTFRLISLEDEG